MPYSTLDELELERLHEAMRQAGYVVRDDDNAPTDQPSWKALNDASATRFLRDHKVNAKPITKGSATYWGMFHKMFSRTDLENAGFPLDEQELQADEAARSLADKVWGACAIGHNSPAQLAAYADGLVVCEASVKLPAADGSLKLTKLRFASNNPELVMDYYVKPYARQLENYFKTTNNRIRVPLDRIPGLEDKIALEFFEAVVTGAKKLEAIKEVMEPITAAKAPKAVGTGK
jgi:hypothetical protein